MRRWVTRRSLSVVTMFVVALPLGAACDEEPPRADLPPPTDVRYESWEEIRDRLEEAGFAVENIDVGDTSGPGQFIADEWGYIEVDGDELAVAIWDDERQARTIVDEFTTDGPTELSLVSGPNWMLLWAEDDKEPSLDQFQEVLGGVVHEVEE